MTPRRRSNSYGSTPSMTIGASLVPTHVPNGIRAGKNRSAKVRELERRGSSITLNKTSATCSTKIKNARHRLANRWHDVTKKDACSGLPKWHHLVRYERWAPES